MRRPFLPLVACSDASTEFGFGASIREMPVDVVRGLACYAFKHGPYVAMDAESNVRKESPFSISKYFDFRLDDFTHIIRVRKRKDDHINMLEGEAFLLLLRWVLRSRARHASRIVVLVDSAVWAGAAAKRRSSSRLNRFGEEEE